MVSSALRAVVERYFFPIEADGQRFDDEEGREFPNFETARQMAFTTAAQIDADDLATGVEWVHQRIIIADENGAELLSVKIDATVHVRAGSRQ
jgi:hypothetical protein